MTIARRARVLFVLICGMPLSCTGGGANDEPYKGASAGGTTSGGAQGMPGGAGGAAGGTGGIQTGTGGAGGAAAGSGGATSAGGSSTGGAGAGGENGGGAGAGGTNAGGASGSSGLSPYKGVANSECADLARLGASWWYNWTLSPGGCDAGEFVPMISGKNEKTAGAVTSALNQIANAGYAAVLGFNEPNKTDQANLTVEQVLDLWPAITENPAIRVGSPATSADAQAWFNAFMAEVEEQGLRVDFIAIHWYGWNAGSCNNANELENYIDWAEGFGRPIWITEWGCLNQSNPTPEVVEGFYTAAIEMFDAHPMIERYAWYPWTANNELVEAGELTELGNLFAQAPSRR